MLKKYIPFHLLIGLILGILLQFYTNFWSDFLWTPIFLVLFLLLSYLFKYRVIFHIISFLCFVFVGLQSIYTADLRNHTDYYGNFVNKNSILTLEISKKLKSNSKFEANIIKIDTHQTKGKTIVIFDKDSLSKTVEIGGNILVTNELREVVDSKNPYAFNYCDYLNKKGIYHQIYVNNKFKILKNKSFSIRSYLLNIRDFIQKKIIKIHFSEESFSILNAMLLGDRNFISENIKNSYANAGVIHILAISGLHIGILTLLLMWGLKFLNQFKYGNFLQVGLVIVSLWFFALLSGLSASVVRSVTMFSFIVLAKLFQHKTKTLFSVITSMFLLLLINPLFLFDLGFQFSYSAVFGIILLNPVFIKFWKPENKITFFFWNIVSVSLSAQIATLPLSLYYFKQFPVFSILSNIVIITIIPYVLGLGILVILSVLLNFKTPFLYAFYEFVISKMNVFVHFMAKIPIIKGLYISFLELIFLYVFIYLIYQLIHKAKPKFVILMLMAIVGLQSFYIFKNIENTDELIVFHQYKNTVISKKINDNLSVLSDSKKLDFIKNYQNTKNIDSICVKSIPNIVKFKKENILIIDSLGIYKVNLKKRPIILLRQSPKINLNRVIEILKPNEIIADGSNYKNYIKYWKQTCNKYKIPFHDTYKQGVWRKFLE